MLEKVYYFLKLLIEIVLMMVKCYSRDGMIYLLLYHLTSFPYRFFRLSNALIRNHADSHFKTILNICLLISTRRSLFHFFCHSNIIHHIDLHEPSSMCLYHVSFQKENLLYKKLRYPNNIIHILQALLADIFQYRDLHY